MCEHQRSYIPSRMRVKASLLDDNQEQYAKCECFSDLMSVRAEKTRAKQVAWCFWCAVPLRTHLPTYDRMSAPSCIHLQMHVKGSVRLWSPVASVWKKLWEWHDTHLFWGGGDGWSGRLCGAAEFFFLGQIMYTCRGCESHDFFTCHSTFLSVNFPV